jgi:hypothetical protein
MISFRARLALLTAMILCLSQSALAYCSTPTAPFCATRYGAFDDESEFRRCKFELESYKSEAESLLACQKREADEFLSNLKRKSDGVIQEYNDAVESFNRRARG